MLLSAAWWRLRSDCELFGDGPDISISFRLVHLPRRPSVGFSTRLKSGDRMWCRLTSSVTSGTPLSGTS